MTDDGGELHQLRESLRTHYLVLAEHGKDPWTEIMGADFDRYVVLLDTLARQSGSLEVPTSPWPLKTVVSVDKQSKAVGILNGPPLLGGPA